MTPRAIANRIQKAPTILDVAAAAGVSKSTVSNVVRAAPAVSAATRRRVLPTTTAAELAHAIHIPVVTVGVSEQSSDSIGPDDAAGATMATDHLLALGHRRIAYLRTPLLGATADRARHRAYAATLRQAGMRPLPIHAWTPGSHHVVVGRRTIDLASALTTAAAPTAAFVSNDAGAMAFIDTCESLGFRVPDALSVVGFDDIAIARHGRIALTTVARTLEDEAERAVSLLLERVGDPGLAPRHERVEVVLRERGSTAPPAPG